MWCHRTNAQRHIIRESRSPNLGFTLVTCIFCAGVPGTLSQDLSRPEREADYHSCSRDENFVLLHGVVHKHRDNWHSRVAFENFHRKAIRWRYLEKHPELHKVMSLDRLVLQHDCCLPPSTTVHLPSLCQAYALWWPQYLWQDTWPCFLGTVSVFFPETQTWLNCKV
jgi:hypothetical protein